MNLELFKKDENKEISLTSLEIAELTGKEHRNVTRDIETYLEKVVEGGISKFGDTYQNTQNKQSYKYYRLPKREVLILVSGYSVELIENQSLKNEAEQNAPLIHFANRIQNTNDAILIRDYAKILHEKNNLEIGEKRLFKILREKGFLMSDNKPYQKYIEQGLFKVSETTVSTINGDRLVSTTKITGKGQIAILKAILKAS
ncbi:DNA-binding protein [Campylobacter jejuni]|nr:DNA-binding protein [Campylobacter jejuni]EAJ2142323.1 DNA-binding protein [Campylobacter jejuni]